MEKAVDKIMMISFIVGAALCYYVMSVLIGVLSNSWGTFARLSEPQVVSHGVPIAVGIGFFMYATFSKSVRSWAEEVIVEVSKVVWPSKKDTYAMTIVVTFIMILSGIILAVFDKLSLWVIQFILEVL